MTIWSWSTKQGFKMWVNSKTAAAVFCVNHKSVEKSAFRATKQGKNFCSLKSHICNFMYSNGIGRGGKVLQIWIDDAIIAEFEATNGVRVSINGIIQGSKCADLHGILNEIPQESQNLANLPPASFNNGSLNTGDYFETHGVSRNDNNSSLDSSPCVRKAQNDGLENLGGCSVSADSFGSAISGATNEVSSKKPFVHEKKFLDTSATSEAECSNLLSSKKSTASQTQSVAVIGCETTSFMADGVCVPSALSFMSASQAQRDIAYAKKAIIDEWELNKKGLLVLDSSLCVRKAQNDGKSGGGRSSKDNGGSLDCFEPVGSRNDNRGVSVGGRKGKILSVVKFIEYINNKKIYPINLTKNKLFAWIRAYNEELPNGEIAGMDALIDQRGNERVCALEKKENKHIKELCIKAIQAQQGSINILGIYNNVNEKICEFENVNSELFWAKKIEFISYGAIKSFTHKYLKNNPLVKKIIQKGDDSAVSSFMPSLGVSNWAVESINQVVEIDASPLDVMANMADLEQKLGFDSVSSIFKDKDEFRAFVEQWQKRYTIIQLIDTYSGVSVFHIAESENSNAVARAVGKYILRYGKMQTIKGDNGKAFKSKANLGFLHAIGVKFQAVRAYSGWCKPFVERNFRSLQNMLCEHLKGYIGHNITDRQAIEFFFSKKERRLKRGQKSNLKELMDLEELQNLVDEFSEKYLNNRYLDRLGATPREAYNQRADEAVAVDSLRLSVLMSEKLKRKVLKKGVSINGRMFYNEKIFEFIGCEIFVRANLDDNKEWFAFDEKENFLGALKLLDLTHGVSVEVAKATQKIFNKKLKETKELVAASRREYEEWTKQKVINSDMPRVVALPQVVGSDIENELMLSRNAVNNSLVSDEFYEKNYGTEKKSGFKNFADMAEAKFNKDK